MPASLLPEKPPASLLPQILPTRNRLQLPTEAAWNNTASTMQERTAYGAVQNPEAELAKRYGQGT